MVVFSAGNLWFITTKGTQFKKQWNGNTKQYILQVLLVRYMEKSCVYWAGTHKLESMRQPLQGLFDQALSTTPTSQSFWGFLTLPLRIWALCVQALYAGALNLWCILLACQLPTTQKHLNKLILPRLFGKISSTWAARLQVCFLTWEQCTLQTTSHNNLTTYSYAFHLGIMLNLLPWLT